MYNYEKRLQYPVNIKIKSPKIAQIVISQYGGHVTRDNLYFLTSSLFIP